MWSWLKPILGKFLISYKTTKCRCKCFPGEWSKPEVEQKADQKCWAGLHAFILWNAFHVCGILSQTNFGTNILTSKKQESDEKVEDRNGKFVTLNCWLEL